MTKAELRNELVFADEEIEAAVVYRDTSGQAETIAFFKDSIEAEAFCKMAHKELSSAGTWNVEEVTA